MKIPVFLPVTREFGFRDEFAQDCLLQRGVTCEPRRPGGVEEREWFAERRTAAKAAQYQALLAGYRVIVRERPRASP